MCLSLVGTLFTLAIGVLAGTVTGLAGASGVIVVVPLLSILLDFSVHQSIGTSLLVDVIASSGALIIYRRYGNVELMGVWMALSSVLGAQLGAMFSAYTPEWGLGWGFGIFLLLTGLAMCRGKGNIEAILTKLPKINYGEANKSLRILIVGIAGLIIGVIAGIFGAGGGIMFLITLIIVFNLPLHKAIGTSTLIMLVTAFSGAVGYALHGYLRPTYGIIAGIGAIIGSTLTAKIANRTEERKLARVVGALFIALGIMMLLLKGR